MEFDDRSLQNLLDHGLASLTPAARVSLLEDQWALVRCGLSTVEQFMDVLSAFRDERDHVVVRAMAARLEASYRLKYVAQRSDECGFTGIPDGGFKTICVPVPVGQLADLYRCVEEMSHDPRLMTPVSARIELRFGTINYVVGKSPAWTQDPTELFIATFEAGGVLPLGLPQLEHGKDGSSAWTVRRLVYVASIGVPFAGVEFVVERLAERGLIKRHSENADSASGIEFDAFVAACAIELQGRSAAWMDAQATRRVFYLLNSEEELTKGGVERMMEATAQTEEESRALIEQAQTVSALQRAWFEREIFVPGAREVQP